MPMDRFFIAPLNSGLQTDMKPWQIMDDAFAKLKNAYLFRGRIRKRFGTYYTGSGWSAPQFSPLFSRLSIPLTGGSGVGTTDGAGNATGTVPGNIFKVGQLFNIGTAIYTVYQTGTPANMLQTVPTVTATYNTTTGAYNFVGAPINSQIYFFPAEPVMGITQYDQGNFITYPTFAFDTQFAYTFPSNFWAQSTGVLWHGNNLNFFWIGNWQGATPDVRALFVTNFNANIGLGLLTDDPIWFYNGTWSPFSYAPDATINPGNLQPLTVTRTSSGNSQIFTNYVQTARIVLPFKDRLLLLNTIENNANGITGSTTITGVTPANYQTSTNTAFPNRCRFSHNGSPLANNAWLEPNQTYNPGGTGALTADGGGFIDAPTDQQIISAEFIKDRLIVFFERSTWELAYTGNQVLPFVWQQLNTELGSEATLSSVPFDKVILTMGTTGVHACNGSNVERIDNQIPDQVFDIVDKNTGVQRVGGVRDYFAEMVYWTFPTTTQNPNEVYPTQVLVYNYKTGTWALNDDCITAWGYFDAGVTETWANNTDTWQVSNQTWDSGQDQQNFRQVVAGNQEGFVIIVDADHQRNAGAMQITNMTFSAVNNSLTLTIVDHTLNIGDPILAVGDYILIEYAQGVTGVNYDPSTNPNGGCYRVNTFINTNTVTVTSIAVINFTGVYTGGGVASRVSNYDIRSKQWNPYNKIGRDFYLAQVDFNVLKTSDGEVTVDYYPSFSELSLIDQGGSTGTGANTSTYILETTPYSILLYPLEHVQDQLWHQLYFNSNGNTMQLRIFMNDAEMQNPAISFSPFELHGLCLHTQPTNYRLE